jgi:tetraacyldisaccharide 4'-kinase
MKKLRLLLWPISFLYGLGLMLRNLLFDWGVFSTKKFPKPATIGVGNLSVGGTGKTPHVAYIVRLIQEEYKTATLSRGYGRRSKGFVLASKASSALEIGDEPRQFRQNFPEKTVVAVDEKRVHGITKLMNINPDLQVVVLDDVFQHRHIQAGIQILLTDFNSPFYSDYLLPTGYLREAKSGYKRADIIVITKTPVDTNAETRRAIKEHVRPLKNQVVCFSSIKYGELISIADSSAVSINALSEYSVLLLTAIANPEPLALHLQYKVKSILRLDYKDHHDFTASDMVAIRKNLNAISENKKIIITTEKDAMRLSATELKAQLAGLPIYYLPIEIEFQQEDAHLFNQKIKNYVRENQSNR